MASCKECANGEVCGDVLERAAELCEVFVNKDSAKEKYMKQVYLNLEKDLFLNWLI